MGTIIQAIVFLTLTGAASAKEFWFTTEDPTDKCYFTKGTHNRNYYKAINFCAGRGMTLPTYTTLDEVEFFANKVADWMNWKRGKGVDQKSFVLGYSRPDTSATPEESIASYLSQDGSQALPGAPHTENFRNFKNANRRCIRTLNKHNWQWDETSCGKDKYHHVCQSEVRSCFPPEIEDSLVDPTAEFTFNQTLKIECIPGFELLGEKMPKCRCNGEWHYDDIGPICERRNCGDPEVLNGEGTSPNGTWAGESVTVECDPGFELAEAGQEATCDLDGVWTVPDCVPIECDPLTIENGQPDENVTVAGAVTDVTCDAGYKAGQSPATATCNIVGIWEDIATCERIQCPDTPIRNGALASTGLSGSGTDINCDAGYELAPEGAQAQCDINGVWELPLPWCTNIPCETLTIPNGAPNRAIVWSGDTVGVTCDPKYELDSEDPATCDLGTGKWTYQPNCERIECPPLTVLNGSAETQPTFSGESTGVVCEPGFALTPADQDAECGETGQWAIEPTCERIVCPTYELHSGTVTPETVYAGQSATVTCNSEGLVLKGYSVIQCDIDGNWIGEQRYCAIDVMVSGDNQLEFCIDGNLVSLANSKRWSVPDTLAVPVASKVVGMSIINTGFAAGGIAAFSTGQVTDSSWKCKYFGGGGRRGKQASTLVKAWNNDVAKMDWCKEGYNDLAGWAPAAEKGGYRDGSWGENQALLLPDTLKDAKWIFPASAPKGGKNTNDRAICRLELN